MKTRWLRTVGWRDPFPLLRRRPGCLQSFPLDIRFQSAASAIEAEPLDVDTDSLPKSSPRQPLTELPSPPPEHALKSAKLAALHARLSLPPKVPLQTLARTLVDYSADSNPKFNNVALAQLGNNLMAYHASEHLICHFPRLPMTVLYAAMYAYVGPKTLSAVVREWGVESAAEPGGEVDSGLLQFKHIPHEEYRDPAGRDSSKSHDPEEEKRQRRNISSRIVTHDEFGDPLTYPSTSPSTTLERAHTNFARAVLGAMYLHCGRTAAKTFLKAHFLSRHLSFSALFDFKQPTRDLSRLCAREGFAGPVARLISETGRLSRHPVFIVGVYSGDNKLGEGSGASLDEARNRAATAALKSWYLYTPVDVRVPSQMEEIGGPLKEWKPVLIDGGEVIV